MSLVDRLARELAPRVRIAKKPVEEATKSAARGAPEADTGSTSERASGVVQPRHPTPLASPVPAQWRGSCKAVSAETGRACALLGGHAGPHRHGSTAFIRTATPGQTHFARRAALDTAASSRLVDSTLTHGAP